MSDTKGKLIKAAKELFEINGYAATTTKEIAHMAGVSEVTLFRHFETKRNLFEKIIHDSLHPYKLEDYLENEVQYDLDIDLRIMAKNMMKTYQSNVPLMRMVFKDGMHDSMSKMHLWKHERNANESLKNYFKQMHAMGRMKADPKMAMIFCMNNIAGYIAKSMFMEHGFKNNPHGMNQEYFDWMIGRVIFALKN